MNHLDLFSGIGGFALAAERVWGGSVEHTFCDNDPFCQVVLKKHWPNAPIYDDIRALNAGLKDGTIGLWNGNAQNVKNDLSPKIGRTVNPAIQKGLLHGVGKIAPIIGRRNANGIEKEKTKSSSIMVGDVLAAGKKKKRSSQSTISMETETLNDGNTNHKHGSSSSNEDSHPIIRSSVTTAITQKHTEYAHTTNIDILTGGFPCQPFSQAGKRRGTADHRFLWKDMLETIRITSPRWVVGENVRGLLSIEGGVVFETVCADLEALGYEVQPFVIPACSVGAPHRRDRVWIVANAKHQPARHKKRGRDDQGASVGTTGSDQDATDSSSKRRKRGESGESSQFKEGLFGRDAWREDWPTVATRLCRVDDGVPRRMDRSPRLKALGNAIVPQVAEQILQAIKSIDANEKYTDTPSH